MRKLRVLTIRIIKTNDKENEDDNNDSNFSKHEEFDYKSASGILIFRQN